MIGKSPVDFLNLLFSEEIKENVWTETTRFADQYLQKHADLIASHPKARVHTWIRQPMTLKELDASLSHYYCYGNSWIPNYQV